MSNGKRKGELDELDMEILRHVLAKPTIPMMELQQLVGINRVSLWKRMGNEKFKETLREYQKSALEIIQSAREKAARKLVKLIDSKSDQVARDACRDIIADTLPAKKIAVDHTGKIVLDKPETEKEINEKIEKLLHDANINSGIDKAVAELITKAGTPPPGTEGSKPQ